MSELPGYKQLRRGSFEKMTQLPATSTTKNDIGDFCILKSASSS